LGLRVESGHPKDGIDDSEMSKPDLNPRRCSLRQARLNPQRVNQVKQWIFVYFFLLIFEGVFRKWIFGGIPIIALPLSIVRDPVALLIYVLAWRANVVRGRIRSASLLWLVCLSLLAVLQVMLNPGLSVLVVLYGLRIYWLHLPLIFIMAEVLDYQDLLRIGRWFLLLAGPMAALMVAQFFAPSDSILNRGMVEGIGQIGAALGRIRPAGTFSYNTGAASFNLLVMAFLLYSFVDKRWTSVWLRWVAVVAVVVILPVSGSRGFVLNFGLLLAFALLGGNFNRRLLWPTIWTVAAGVAIFGVLMLTSFFQEGVQTFLTRWNDANTVTGGSFREAIVMRFFHEFIMAFHDLGEAPLFGYGIGLGSNFGAVLTSNALVYELAEAEWERTVLEMGPIFAVLWLGLRCGFGVFIIRRAWGSLRRGHTLGWLILSSEFLAIINGFLQQPTALGFIVFTTGLCLVAVKSAEREDTLPPAGRVDPRIPSRRQSFVRQVRP
jgi:hypothetical protein